MNEATDYLIRWAWDIVWWDAPLEDFSTAMDEIKDLIVQVLRSRT